MDATSVIAALVLLCEGVILVILPLELVWLWRRRKLDRARLREMAGSASTIVPLAIVSSLIFAGVPVAADVSVGEALACIVAVDFLYYWDHRLGHEVRLFWALGHSVHHSSPNYDQSTALRVSALDGPLTLWVYLPALLVFPVGLVVVSLTLVVGYQTWIHTELVGKLPALDGWLNTPSNHRVHHASQARYLDKNYGGIFVIWDRLFGTYERETEAPRYGLTTPIGSSNPITVHTFEAARSLRRLRTLGWRARWHFLWSNPRADAPPA